MFSLKRHWNVVLIAMMTAMATWSVVRVSTAAPDAVASAQEQTAIHTGDELERGEKWLDAIRHYEDASKMWPDSSHIKYGLRRSKYQFSIDRRYHDDSFLNDMLSMSESQSLDLMGEVLNKINHTYFDQISTTYFIAHGTESLYLALDNNTFLKANGLDHLRKDELAQVRRVLYEDYWNKRVSGWQGGRQTIIEVARNVEAMLGLKSTPVIMEYLFGGCNALDKYSTYLSPSKLSDLESNIDGEFVGIGIEMRTEIGKGVYLANVFPESPAEQGGLEPGDYVVEIDGTDCRELSTERAASLLAGPSGSLVRLRWQRDNETELRSGEFRRRKVNVKSVPLHTMLDRQSGIGYIRMTVFQRTSPEEFDQALRDLQRQGMQSLVWDLRGNPGGLLPAAVEVMDRLLDHGTIVSTKGRSHDQNWTYSAYRIGTYDFPLVLLIDGNSASASEIAAGAIHDHKRGTIIGRKSYGKWSVQTIFPVSHGTGLRLTTAKFFSPNDRNFAGIGLEPDIVVPSDEDKPVRVRRETIAEDKDIQRAIEFLKQEQYTLK